MLSKTAWLWHVLNSSLHWLIYLTQILQLHKLHSVDELKRMWMEVFMVCLKGSVPRFAWKNWGMPRALSVRIPGLRAKIRTQDFPNFKYTATFVHFKQKLCPLFVSRHSVFTLSVKWMEESIMEKWSWILTYRKILCLFKVEKNVIDL
jgi:hypothetical protein